MRAPSKIATDPEGGPLRPVKELVRTGFQASFEGLWSRLLPLLGTGRGRIVPVEQLGGEREVLVIAPHPDDEVAGCAAALLAHRRAGDRVELLCVSDGRSSTAYGLGPESMAAEREKEARAAAALLDVELTWLGLPEGAWEVAELATGLEDLLSQTRPALIYAPTGLDFHPEHQRVARSLALALAGPSNAPRIRGYAMQVPLAPSPANLFVSGVSREQVERALRCHRTQVGSLLCSLRRRRYAARLAGLTGYAEAFWELEARRYSQLHAAPPRAESFRSLRYWAFSDPLAYLKGRRERARWLGAEKEAT